MKQSFHLFGIFLSLISGLPDRCLKSHRHLRFRSSGEACADIDSFYSAIGNCYSVIGIVAFQLLEVATQLMEVSTQLLAVLLSY